MSVHYGNIPAGQVIYHLFDTFAGSTGASITMSGFAAADIEVYKNGSTTQRASDAGYTLLDTDGIDFDGLTGIHGFSIDTGDNTDAGFFSVGGWYNVVVSAITVDSQTVSFVAFSFRLVAAESIAGKPKADVDAFGGTAGTFSGGRPEVNTTHWSGTANAAPDTAGYPKVTLKSGTGTGEISLSNGRVALQSGIRKNQAIANFPFLMTDSTNHNPATGLTVSATRSIDGAAFGAGTIANMTEVGNGVYQCDLGAGDLNGDTIALRFAATGADDLVITLVTEP